MKKTILKAAVAAALILPTAVMAEATLYGNLHFSLNQADNDITGADNNLKLSSNTSSIGVKGSEDLGDGLKALYKAEWEVDTLDNPTTNPDQGNTSNGALTGRDQWVGLKGGMGTIKIGTMSSNWKQTGGKVDPLYRTPLEGRGFLNTQSSDLHGGKGVNRGRQTDTVQYSSPKMGGIQLVANTTFSGATDVTGSSTDETDETTGVGIRWANKSMMVYVDWIDAVPNTPTNLVSYTSGTESAFKVGGKFSTKAFSVGLQYEAAEDLVGADFIVAAGTFNIDKNNMIALTYGMADVNVGTSTQSQDTEGMAIAYNHKMSKMTNVYVGYGAKSSDVDNNDESMITAGIKKKF